MVTALTVKERPWRHAAGSVLSTVLAGSALSAGEPPGDISDLLAACNAYVDNIVSENQRMRSKLLSCRSKLSGPTQASD